MSDLTYQQADANRTSQPVSDRYPLPVKSVGTISVSVAQTVAATAHASGDCVGGKISFANAARDSGGGGTIQSVIVRDKAAQSVIYDLILFNADPSAATITDDAAFVFSTDLAKCIGHVPIDDLSTGTQGVLTASGVGLQFKLASGTTLYAALVTRGAPTYASPSDVEVEIVIIPD